MAGRTNTKRHRNGWLAEPKRRRRNGWTPERRARQAEMIRTWRPWTRSTGPKTPAGKMRTRLNAQTHGFRGERGRVFYAALREQRKFLRAINRLASYLDSCPLSLQGEGRGEGALRESPSPGLSLKGEGKKIPLLPLPAEFDKNTPFALKVSPMTPDKKLKNVLKAAFSSGNLNGTAATLMSLGMGSAPASAMYVSAVAAGLYNKIRALSDTDGSPKSRVLNALTDPSITARILMFAAVYNFANASYDTFSGPAADQAANALRMAGWACGFLGDNALRRLDAVNFRGNGSLRAEGRSRLRETFNALTANPTLFYNGASIAFTMAVLSKQPEGMFTSMPGMIGLAATALIGAGVFHALRQTWSATQGKIGMDKINDGVMNYFSSASKGIQSVVSVLSGNYWLAAAQTIFTGSNVKLIYETRDALDKKPSAAVPG